MLDSPSQTFVTPPGIDFGRLLEFAARFYADRIAVIDETASITFAEADRRACSLAAAFGDIDARKGDRVAIILPNCIAFIIAEMAVIKTGMVKVPLNIRFHEKEVLFALEDCQPTILICEATFAKKGSESLARVTSLRGTLTLGGSVNGSMYGTSPVRSVRS